MGEEKKIERGNGRGKGNGRKREKNMHSWESHHCFSTRKEEKKRKKKIK